MAAGKGSKERKPNSGERESRGTQPTKLKMRATSVSVVARRMNDGRSKDRRALRTGYRGPGGWWCWWMEWERENSQGARRAGGRIACVSQLNCLSQLDDLWG